MLDNDHKNTLVDFWKNWATPDRLVACCSTLLKFCSLKNSQNCSFVAHHKNECKTAIEGPYK